MPGCRSKRRQPPEWRLPGRICAPSVSRAELRGFCFRLATLSATSTAAQPGAWAHRGGRRLDPRHWHSPHNGIAHAARGPRCMPATWPHRADRLAESRALPSGDGAFRDNSTRGGPGLVAVGPAGEAAAAARTRECPPPEAPHREDCGFAGSWPHSGQRSGVARRS